MARAKADHPLAARGLDDLTGRGRPAGAAREHAEQRGLVDPESRVRRTDAKHGLLLAHRFAFGDRPHLIALLENPAKQPCRLGDAAEDAA